MNDSLSSPNQQTVCGSEIQNPERYPSDYFRGEQVYFCTKACLLAFRAEPDRFIAGEIDHPEEES
jgi:YHS domain-containing protein